MIPVLMITYGRLEYTKRSLEALMNSRLATVYVIDNGSTDGTVEWIQSMRSSLHFVYNSLNIGIAGAMNQFLHKTPGAMIAGKVDNDTVVPVDWIEKLLPHLQKTDIVQAKHHLIKATHPAGFDDWVSTMKADGPLRFNHFVGGTGILFKRNIISRIPATEWKLGGWRQWQREHPEFKKAFATDVEIELLDTNENGEDYSAYPDYYKETKRTS